MNDNEDIRNIRDLRSIIKNAGFKKFKFGNGGDEKGLDSICGWWIGESGFLNIESTVPNKLELKFLSDIKIETESVREEIEEDTPFKKIAEV